MNGNREYKSSETGTGSPGLDVSLFWEPRALLLLAVAAISACSGGGDDDEEGGPESNDADLIGLWTGTETRDGGMESQLTVVVAPGGPLYVAGRFVSASPELYLFGSGDTFGNSFSADADGWPMGNNRTSFPDGSSIGHFTLSGTAASRSRINGSYAGAGESGTWSLTYESALSARRPSLATVAGSYVTAGGGSLAITNGEITYSRTIGGTNCIANGTISFDDPAINVYNWEMTFAGGDGCFDGDAGGLAYIRDASDGGSNNQLLLLGTQGPPFRPAVIVATK